MSNQLLVVKKEYVELVAAKCQQLNKRTQECAAKLIHYFLNWTSWKKTVHRTEWVYQKLKQIYVDFFGLHSLHCIRAAIARLIEAGILERRNNPGNLQDKTYQYRVNFAVLNVADSVTEAEDSDPNSEDSTVENHTKNQYIESNQKIRSIQEEEEKDEKKKMPEELKNKLEELEIPLDKKVKAAIKTHHISQAYGAINHIKNTRETISNPRGVFLWQIGKQPVETMGTRGKVHCASDYGYTLEDLKQMYPLRWREAAAHFGVAID